MGRLVSRPFLLFFFKPLREKLQFKIQNKKETIRYALRHLYAIRSRGFTLIELLVSIAIIGTLAAVLIVQLNPLGQINKAKDAQRTQEIAQIAQAMESYYNDNNRYPAASEMQPLLTTEGEWKVGSTVYMKKFPKADGCTTGNEATCYVYQTDSASAKPQWGVVFAKLSLSNTNQVTNSICSLKSLPSCLPQNYNSTWACAVVGKVNCAQIIALALPETGIVEQNTPVPPTVAPPTTAPTITPMPSITPVGPTPTGTPVPPTPTLTPTPTQPPCPMAADNLIQNPCFETNFASWDQISSGIGEWSIDLTTVKNGVGAAKLIHRSGSWGTQISQIFTTTATTGSVYNYNFAVYNPQGSWVEVAIQQAQDPWDNIATNSIGFTTGGWASVSRSVTIPINKGTSFQIYLRTNTPNIPVWFDNVQVVRQ